MQAVAPLADYARAERSPASADNPFIAMQQQFSKAMVDALNLFRDVRDDLIERAFHALYGSPLVQAACGISQNDGPPRPRGLGCCPPYWRRPCMRQQRYCQP